jgi:hypothetical protein
MIISEREINNMLKKPVWLIILAILPLAPLVFGCGDLGRVDQGRVIAYNKDKGTVTIIQDKDANPGKPNYNTLPPHVYALPTDPTEIGALPKPGGRMNLDTKGKTITIFDPSSQNFKKIDYTLIDEKDNVAKDSPLVVEKKFPLVDKAKKTITIYSPRQKILVTLTVPEEYFALPDNTWDAGDEVRIYFHKEGVAQRFMNISKTDIFKK